MSEDRTKETKDPRSFEERVFARFDAIDERFDRVEGRLSTVEIKVTKLDARQYNTKPIWERALAEIAELSRAIREQGSQFQNGLESLRTDLRSEFQTGMENLRTDLRSEFQTGMESLRTDLRSEFQTGIESLRTDLRSEFQTGMDDLRADLRSEFQTGIESLRTEMKAEFASVRHEMEHGFRRVARTVDTLNHNVLEMQTYQRYVDKRLEGLET